MSLVFSALLVLGGILTVLLVRQSRLRARHGPRDSPKLLAVFTSLVCAAVAILAILYLFVGDPGRGELLLGRAAIALSFVALLSFGVWRNR